MDDRLTEDFEAWLNTVERLQKPRHPQDGGFSQKEIEEICFTEVKRVTLES